MVTKIITRILGLDAKKSTRKVLVVDDDPDLIKLINHYLKPLDCFAKNVNSVQEALGVLEADSRYRLIVTDIVLPGKNGLSLITKVRKTPKWSKIPVLVISAEVPPKVLQGLPSEFSRVQVMCKPLRMKPFQDMVQDALKTAFASVPNSAPIM